MILFVSLTLKRNKLNVFDVKRALKKSINVTYLFVSIAL